MSCILSVAHFRDAKTETLRAKTGSSKSRFKPRKSVSYPLWYPGRGISIVGSFPALSLSFPCCEMGIITLAS